MRTSGNIAAGILLGLLAGAAPRLVPAAELLLPEPLSKAVLAVLLQSSAPAEASHATDRDGLLMVESETARFDCMLFESIASPSGAHRAELASQGWRYLRRERRPEGDDTVVESQLYGRNGVGVELAFIKVASRNVCGVQAFVSKRL